MAIEIFFFSSKSSVPGAGGVFLLLPIAYHFVVFFLFSFFLLATIKGNKKLKTSYLIIVLIFSVIYAISDEFHQSFVPGRNADIKDVLTDSVGIILSLLISIYIEKKRKIKRK
jgi:VanZ family protein